MKNVNKVATEKPVKCTVTFDSKGGSKVSKVRVLAGTSVTALKTPKRKGYTFDGWFEDVARTKPFTGKQINSDLTVYAKWHIGLKKSDVSKYYRILRKKLAGRCALNDGYKLAPGTTKTFIIVKRDDCSLTLYLPIPKDQLLREGYEVSSAPEKSEYAQTPTMFVVNTTHDFRLALHLVDRVISTDMLQDIKRKDKPLKREGGCALRIHADKPTRGLKRYHPAKLKNSNFEKIKPWLYLSPALVLLAIFTVWPIINTVRIAFLEGYSMMGALNGNVYKFGFGNFEKVISYSGFGLIIKNTMLLCVVTVPISTVLALLISVALNSIRPLRRFFQTIFFLPYVTNSIAIGMVFAAMFNVVGNISADNGKVVSAGIINNILGLFGVDTINWINVGSTWEHNFIVMVVYIVWNALPFKILIILGGLQGINKQYYEAAKVDGTSKARVLWRITVPLLSPILAYVLITSFIGGFKEYSSIVGVFGEGMGPADSVGTPQMQTMVGFIYKSLSGTQQGRASAAALILFGIILVVTLLNLYVSKKKTHY